MDIDVDLESMTEAERRTYYFSKSGHRINKPTFARHLIMRRLKKRYSKEGYFNGLTDNMMCKIVDRIFELKVQRLPYDGYIELGFGLGKIFLSDFEYEPKEFIQHRVSYKKTLDYWAKNPDAYRKKIVIREFLPVKKILYFIWKRKKVGNIIYYTFVPQKKLKRKLYHDYLNGNVIILKK